MQNRYAGDIGDYIKLSLLRALCEGYRLGVAWWLVPDESHNTDGRHISYLDEKAHWRQLDPLVFDHLDKIIHRGTRSVKALEESGVFPVGTEFVDAEVPMPFRWADRAAARKAWFGLVVGKLHRSTMVFLDPDNGIEPARYSLGRRGANKSIRLSEIAELLQPGRTLIVYHHHTRLRGGHANELQHHANKLRTAGASRIDALRAKAYSPRAFFILDGTKNIQTRAAVFADRWAPHVTWHPNLG